ncbi:MAG: ATP synthase F1 subunit gamma [Chloroflexi bacterium RBG_16_48_8]|nr:MAG: ATP synthase F1 subunit gamma [Chloroflexi bacterium RBG_16_48_8]
MASDREMRLRIQGVSNIAQVTRALEAVSASKVRQAQRAVELTRPYASKAWDVLQHLSRQPARDFIHPLLKERETIDEILVILITGDRGLAGAYNSNVVRFALEEFREAPVPVRYILVGRKGRDMMARRGQNIQAEFSHLPAAPSYADVSAIGRIAVDEYLEDHVDQVYLVYTQFVNMLRQVPAKKLLLPLEMEEETERVKTYGQRTTGPEPAYIYEPSMEELIERIVPRLTALQIYQAILESLASEHAARMVAMRNATENANELVYALRLTYNKARQGAITSEILDIVGGAEALASAQEGGL